MPGRMTTRHGKRAVAVHHREPGNSAPSKMLTLYLGCPAKVTPTNYVQDDWPEFLRVLWREQHRDGQEQDSLSFILNALWRRFMQSPPWRKHTVSAKARSAA